MTSVPPASPHASSSARRRPAASDRERLARLRLDLFGDSHSWTTPAASATSDSWTWLSWYVAVVSLVPLALAVLMKRIWPAVAAPLAGWTALITCAHMSRSVRNAAVTSWPTLGTRNCRIEDVHWRAFGQYDGVRSQHSEYVPNALLSRLVGFRLYSVQFVMDYAQLRFDGPTEDMPVLNCDVLPVVETPAGLIAAGQLGYADALCAFIPGHVVATVEETGRGLRIEFDEGTVCLHPDADEVPGQRSRS